VLGEAHLPMQDVDQKQHRGSSRMRVLSISLLVSVCYTSANRTRMYHPISSGRYLLSENF
jgi:hypothetical protein